MLRVQVRAGLAVSDVHSTRLDHPEHFTGYSIVYWLTSEGDTTSFYIYRKLAKYNLEITSLARGVSIGNELEYTDEITLGRSLVNRVKFEIT